MTIRPERDGDAAAIRAVHEAAFGGADEADVVEALRESGAQACALVAEDGGRVVGHVAFSPVAIDPRRDDAGAGAGDGAGARVRVAAIGLVPVAVRPEAQGRGVGSALIRAGLDELRRAGEGAVVVLGHPSYYPRFGFRDARDLGLAWERPCDEGAFMALELVPGALRGAGGVVRYRPEVMGYRVRRADSADIPAVQAIEVAAAARFRASPHAGAAAAPPLPADYLAPRCAAGDVWLVLAPGGEPAAFIALTPLGDDALYVAEVDVVPGHAGARLGAALLDHAALLARRRGLARLVLRTFADVPWNAPYYRRLGFADVPVPPALAAVAAKEAEAGFELARRVTLARPVTAPR